MSDNEHHCEELNVKEERIEDEHEQMMKINEACRNFVSISLCILNESLQDGAIDDQQSGEEGESDLSGSPEDKISDEQSDFTNSSGSSRSPL